MKEPSISRNTIIYLLLFLYFCFLLTPIVWLVVSSFKKPSLVLSSKLIPGIGDFSLENYVETFQMQRFAQYFLNSLKIALGNTGLTLLVTILAGYALSRFRIRGGRQFLLAVLASWMFPYVLILISFYYIMLALNLTDTILGIVLTHSVLSISFCVWILKAYFDGIPKELDDAALIDGSSRIGTLFKIILPISSPGIAVAAFFAFMVSWGDFLFVSILSRSPATRTLPLILQAFRSTLELRWGVIVTATVICIIPTVALFAFVQRWLVEGLTAGAIK